MWGFTKYIVCEMLSYDIKKDLIFFELGSLRINFSTFFENILKKQGFPLIFLAGALTEGASLATRSLRKSKENLVFSRFLLKM